MTFVSGGEVFQTVNRMLGTKRKSESEVLCKIRKLATLVMASRRMISNKQLVQIYLINAPVN